MISMKIGYIVEEENDFEVIVELTKKIVPTNRFATSKFVSHGCGKLRCKCSAWSKILQQRGCHLLVVIHDLDSRKLNTLKKELESSITTSQMDGKLVLIPVKEMESWLLFDEQALAGVFSIRKKIQLPNQPEQIDSPKEHLRDLVWKNGRKRYINTVHNRRIAEEIDIQNLRECRSYTPYEVFLRTHFGL